jgi:hypothetical protein
MNQYSVVSVPECDPGSNGIRNRQSSTQKTCAVFSVVSWCEASCGDYAVGRIKICGTPVQQPWRCN